MEEVTIAFYAIVSATAAGMFGLGAGLLATRVVSLAERASALTRERVDLTFEVGEKFGDSWTDRHRLGELAAIHRLTRRIEQVVTWSFSFTGLVVLVTLLVVGGVVPDSTPLRWSLIVSLTVAATVWVVALRAQASRVVRFTARYGSERTRSREEEGAGVFGRHFGAEDVEEAIRRLYAGPISASKGLTRLRLKLGRRRARRRSPVDSP